VTAAADAVTSRGNIRTLVPQRPMRVGFHVRELSEISEMNFPRKRHRERVVLTKGQLRNACILYGDGISKLKYIFSEK